MLTPVERALSADEHAALSARLAGARRDAGRALAKAGAAAAAVCGVLAAATVAASDAPNGIIAGFWAALWILFTLAVGLPTRKLMRFQVSVFEDALRARRVREIRIQSDHVIEFEEEEDEGACYAFGLDEQSSVFVIGQEFYEDEDFPNSDFSILEILGTKGRPADVRRVTRGRKLVPEHVVPAATKLRLRLPAHLEVVPVPLEELIPN
jgi:hypothetical protein